MRLWLTVEEAAPYIGDDPQSIYRSIRQGDFPWEYVRLGRKIKISARSIGMIPDFWWDSDRAPRSQKGETRNQENLQVTA